MHFMSPMTVNFGAIAAVASALLSGPCRAVTVHLVGRIRRVREMLWLLVVMEWLYDKGILQRPKVLSEGSVGLQG
jgi:hypothetical protein